LDFQFEPGEVEKMVSEEEIKNLENSIQTLKDKIEDAEGKNQEGSENYQQLRAQVRELEKLNEELLKEIRKLDGKTEKDILGAVKRFSRFAIVKPKPRAFTLQEFENFEASYNELESLVIQRLAKERNKS